MKLGCAAGAPEVGNEMRPSCPTCPWAPAQTANPSASAPAIQNRLAVMLSLLGRTKLMRVRFTRPMQSIQLGQEYTTGGLSGTDGTQVCCRSVIRAADLQVPS